MSGKSNVITVELSEDHLKGQIKAAPVQAVSELIWNALDAEADHVIVSLDFAGDTLINSISVADDGLGIDPDHLLTTLSNIGDSWKRTASKSPNGKRSLHGKRGQGRFQAFALGSRVEWNTVFFDKADKKHKAFSFFGDKSRIRQFPYTAPVPTERTDTGTTVLIQNIESNFVSLAGDEAEKRFTEEFAVYLSQYPSVSITYCGNVLDPAAAWEEKVEVELPGIQYKGKDHPVELTIIEWKDNQKRSLYLCNEEGAMLGQVDPQDAKVQVPGFHFTAYIKSSYLSELHRNGEFELAALKPEVLDLIKEAKGAIKQHWLKRRARNASRKVDEWKSKNIYPYEEPPKSSVEEAERDLFDVVAITVNDHLKGFDSAESSSQKLTLRLIKQALEKSPENLQIILHDVLDLKPEAQEDLASLLKNEATNLPSVIKAARTVADRLDFLCLLDSLLYEPEKKKKLKERSQLHKMLEKETWIFGEEYNLAVSDKSLTEVLRRHREALGMHEQGDDIEDESEVTDLEGKRRIVDLMLSMRIPLAREEEREHLVVELKAPRQKINRKVIEQIEDYARGVVNDERFKAKSIKVTWNFVAISNDFDQNAEARASSKTNSEYGLIEEGENYKIWIVRWNQILEGCRGKYSFFQKHLNYEADDETAQEYLKKKHGKVFGDTKTESEEKP